MAGLSPATAAQTSGRASITLASSSHKTKAPTSYLFGYRSGLFINPSLEDRSLSPLPSDPVSAIADRINLIVKTLIERSQHSIRHRND
jgi:hypothetical protein